MLNRLLIILIILLTSCLDESELINPVVELETSALLLREVEARGDFINSKEFPALLDADYVYRDYSEYLLLEIRNKEDYNNGHLENSIRVDNTELFEKVSEVNNSQKILLLSNTGQSSAYYAAILRFYGFKNIYSLNFGIASWHTDFSQYYLPNLDNILPPSGWYESDLFTNLSYSKHSKTFLPKIDSELNSIEDLLQDRIKKLLEEDFPESNLSNESSNTIGPRYVDYMNTGTNYTVCFGTPDLYYIGKTGDPGNPGHPIVSVFYNSGYLKSDLKSTTDLQTMPTDKTIYVYSYSGQRSAMLVAYLKLLGYNAKSILFGGHSMFARRFSPNILAYAPGLAQFAYNTNKIKSYPYVK